jgi:hypothetical protein
MQDFIQRNYEDPIRIKELKTEKEKERLENELKQFFQPKITEESRILVRRALGITDEEGAEKNVHEELYNHDTAVQRRRKELLKDWQRKREEKEQEVKREARAENEKKERHEAVAQRVEQLVRDKKLVVQALRHKDEQMVARLSSITGYLARHNLKKNLGYHADKVEVQRQERMAY